MRGAPFSHVIEQVIFGDQSLASFHFSYDQLGGFPFVKPGLSFLLHTLQGSGQIRLYQGIAGLPGGGSFKRRGNRIVFFEFLLQVVEGTGFAVGDHKTFFGQFDGRFDQGGKRQLGILMCLEQSRYGAGNAGGEVAVLTFLGAGHTIGVDVHIPGSCCRGHLAIIQRKTFAVG